MEVKQRPLYVVAESLGLGADERAARAEAAGRERFERVV
jgi:hypothetical protein